jgi:hypothetical protein
MEATGDDSTLIVLGKQLEEAVTIIRRLYDPASEAARAAVRVEPNSIKDMLEYQLPTSSIAGERETESKLAPPLAPGLPRYRADGERGK